MVDVTKREAQSSLKKTLFDRGICHDGMVVEALGRTRLKAAKEELPPVLAYVAALPRGDPVVLQSSSQVMSVAEITDRQTGARRDERASSARHRSARPIHRAGDGQVGFARERSQRNDQVRHVSGDVDVQGAGAGLQDATTGSGCRVAVRTCRRAVPACTRARRWTLATGTHQTVRTLSPSRAFDFITAMTRECRSRGVDGKRNGARRRVRLQVAFRPS